MMWMTKILMGCFLASCSGVSAPVPEVVSAADDQSVPAAVLQDDTERFEQIYSLDMNGDVVAANINGDIKISTWESPQVQLIAVKTASNPDHLKLVNVEVESTNSLFKVKVKYPDWDDRRDKETKNLDVRVDFELKVPSSANLKTIANVNGDVVIDGAKKVSKAATVNGTVRVSKLEGSVHLSTVNGAVEAEYEYLMPGSEIKLSTVNGMVDLVLPSDVDAEIRANSLSGSIENDFGLPVRKGEFVGRDMHARLGGGDAKIRLSSVSGGLSVRRQNDGRSVNPATNLLRMKDNGDDTY